MFHFAKHQELILKILAIFSFFITFGENKRWPGSFFEWNVSGIGIGEFLLESLTEI
jgi:hypothetical protein